MFDWLPNLIFTLTLNAWLIYGAGIAVGIVLGIQVHMTWCKVREKREDERARQADIEARMSDPQTDHDAVAWKLLQDCEFL